MILVKLLNIIVLTLKITFMFANTFVNVTVDVLVHLQTHAIIHKQKSVYIWVLGVEQRFSDSKASLEYWAITCSLKIFIFFDSA